MVVRARNTFFDARNTSQQKSLTDMKEEFNSSIPADAMKVMSGKYANRTLHFLGSNGYSYNFKLYLATWEFPEPQRLAVKTNIQV